VHDVGSFAVQELLPTICKSCFDLQASLLRVLRRSPVPIIAQDLAFSSYFHSQVQYYGNRENMMALGSTYIIHHQVRFGALERKQESNVTRQENEMYCY